MSRRAVAAVVVAAVAGVAVIAFLWQNRHREKRLDMPAATPTSADTERGALPPRDLDSRGSRSGIDDPGLAALPSNPAKLVESLHPATPPTAVLTGHVRERTGGAPIAGAVVGWRLDRDRPLDVDLVRTEADQTTIRAARGGPAVTDERGAFLLPLHFPASDVPFRLFAQHPTHATAFTASTAFFADAAPRDGIEILLDQGGTIEGTVTPKTPGTPVAGRITADSEASDEDRSIELDVEGRFRITGISPGDVEVAYEGAEPEKEGGAVIAPKYTNVEIGPGETKRVDFTATIGNDVEVVVRQGAGLVDEANVRVRSRATIHSRWATRGEAPGRYFVRGIQAGKATIAVRLGGEATEIEVEVVHGGRNVFTIELPTANVGGQVTIVGSTAPPSRIEVGLLRLSGDGSIERGATEWTEPDGSYQFAELPPGRYALVVEERDSTDGADEDDAHVMSIRPARREFELYGGEKRREDFVVEPAGAVVVSVLDPAGKPLPEAFVTLVSADEATTTETRWDRWFRFGGVTGKDGKVRIRGLEPGRYVVHLDQSELESEPSEAFEAAPGVESAVTIRTKASDRILVLFEILGPDLAVAFDMQLEVKDARGREVETDVPHGPRKAYDFSIVPPGKYEIHIEGDRWVTVDRAFEAKGPSPQTVRVVLTEKLK